MVKKHAQRGMILKNVPGKFPPDITAPLECVTEFMIPPSVRYQF